MSQEPHRYTPLPARHIRVFQLFPGGLEDALECEISITSLEDDPSYEAVSYVWGKTTPPRFIDSEAGFIRITPNLENGLRRIRRKHEVRTLWADQICINQQSLEERSAQVGMMGEIFQLARSVIMWCVSPANSAISLDGRSSNAAEGLVLITHQNLWLR